MESTPTLFNQARNSVLQIGIEFVANVNVVFLPTKWRWSFPTLNPVTVELFMDLATGLLDSLEP